MSTYRWWPCESQSAPRWKYRLCSQRELRGKQQTQAVGTKRSQNECLHHPRCHSQCWTKKSTETWRCVKSLRRKKRKRKSLTLKCEICLSFTTRSLFWAARTARPSSTTQPPRKTLSILPTMITEARSKPWSQRTTRFPPFRRATWS